MSFFDANFEINSFIRLNLRENLDRTAYKFLLSLNPIEFVYSNNLDQKGLTMIKIDIVNRVADKTGVPKQKAEEVVDALFDAMKNALAGGRRIELRGFGVFVVKPRKRGIGRNPRTGEEVPIPAGKTIRFKPGKDLQAKIIKK